MGKNNKNSNELNNILIVLQRDFTQVPKVIY